jgi:TfoX/Sxy family transcriptional regulator of competence genes
VAYDQGLAARLTELLAGRPAIAQKKMFGGLALLCRGHMFVGIVGDTLMVRVGPERYVDALAMQYVREMDFTGRPMKGYVFVDPPGFESDEDLARWVEAGLRFVGSLPPK